MCFDFLTETRRPFAKYEGAPGEIVGVCWGGGEADMINRVARSYNRQRRNRTASGVVLGSKSAGSIQAEKTSVIAWLRYSYVRKGGSTTWWKTHLLGIATAQTVTLGTTGAGIRVV